MKKSFISLLFDFIEANGKKILDQPDRFKSLFLDFSQNEFRAEAQIFCQFLASKQAQELKNNDDVETNFLKGIAERFQQAYLFDKSTCEKVVSAYAFFLGLIDERHIEQIGSIEGKTMQVEQQVPQKLVSEDKTWNGQPIKISKRKILIISAVLVLALSFYYFGREYPSFKREISYSDFINLVERNEIISVTININNTRERSRRLELEGKNQTKFITYIPYLYTDLLTMLKEKGILIHWKN